MKRFLSLAAAFLAGVLVTWAGPCAATDAPRRNGPTGAVPVEAPAAADEPDAAVLPVLASLDARTARILQLLERAPARRVVAAEPLDAPAADVDANEELRLLRALERALQELLARPMDAHAALQQLRTERPDADWTALDPLLAAHESDPLAARQSVQLLSEEEVLRRYGSPGLTYVRDGVVRWVYGQGFVPEQEAYRLQLVFVFEGGLVRDLHVERQ